LSSSLIALVTGHYYFLPWQNPTGVFRADGVLRFQYLRDLALDLQTRVQPGGYEGQLVHFVYF
jgi:hypothetical protein